MLITRVVARGLGVGILVLGTGLAGAQQNYPNKAIRIATSAVGGGSDFASRLIAQGITASLGQPIIIDNRPGVTAAQVVANAPPDGYTLLFFGASFWLLPLLQTAPYDPVKDFAPITLVSTSPNVLVVHPSLPVKTVKQFIALARAKPGALNYASGTNGSGTHLAAELFNTMANVKLVRIAFSGVAQAIPDLLTGQIQVMFPAVGAVAAHVKSRRLTALAVTSAKPTALLPDLPTVATTGLPGFVVVSIDGMFAPAKTPPAIINRLNQEVGRFLTTPDAKERYLAYGVEVSPSSPEEFAAAIKSDLTVWGKVIKDLGLKTD